MPECKVCKKHYEYDTTQGYDKETCSSMCDGVQAGREQAIRKMLQLAGNLGLKASLHEADAIGLAYETSASSIERVCNEIREGQL